MKNSVAVTKLVPYPSRPTSWFGCSRGAVASDGGIVASIDAVWDADR